MLDYNVFDVALSDLYGLGDYWDELGMFVFWEGTLCVLGGEPRT